MGRRIGNMGLVNYRVHPTNQRFHVFGFNTIEEADTFEAELKKRNIWFERDIDEIKEGFIYLFGVDKSDYTGATQANYATSAKHRNPMIKNKFLRIALVSLTMFLLTLGIIGYVKNMQKLSAETEKIENE